MLQRIRESRETENGFTLIELLIVIVVLGILAGIVVFGVSTFRTDATVAACKSSLKTVNVAADAFDAKTGNYPTVIADLTTPAPGYLRGTPANTGALTFSAANRDVTAANCTLP